MVFFIIYIALEFLRKTSVEKLRFYNSCSDILDKPQTIRRQFSFNKLSNVNLELEQSSIQRYTFLQKNETQRGFLYLRGLCAHTHTNMQKLIPTQLLTSISP